MISLNNKIVLKNGLKRFCNENFPCSDFQDWLVTNFWDAEDELVYSIKLKIAEYTSGHRTLEDLKNQLKLLLDN